MPAEEGEAMSLRDSDGYPTEETLERLRTWDLVADGAGALDFLRAAWWCSEALTSNTLTRAEKGIVHGALHSRSSRYLRLSTGGS